jgi:LacI family transcriptional regulator
MSISAKELAKKLNISEAAVSMALNGKPGVSTKTRNEIIAAAHNYGYDFTKVKQSKKPNGTINMIIYRKHGAVVADTPFFSVLTDSIQKTCREAGYKFSIRYLYSGDDVKEQLDAILSSDCIGLILLGTEMREEDFSPFAYVNIPIVLLDTYFNSMKMDCVLINNVEGAYQATHYLIKKRQVQPGYLHSSYPIYNFEERADGFYKAIRKNGMSTSKSIVHLLTPSMEGAYADMKSLLESKEELAKSYFADNDLIAAGAMKALKEYGYKIPEDIAIIGFDNQPICTYIEPNLTTVNVPKEYMGEMAVRRLIHVMESKEFLPIKTEIGTHIIKRKTL